MQVVNKTTHKPTPKDVYVGRPKRGDRRNPLCNEWTHKPGTTAKYLVASREEAIACYKRWLWSRMQAGDRQILNELHSIPEDANLVCWCAPDACHGDVIKAACEWLRKQG